MDINSFLATLDQNDIVVVKTTAQLPDVIHATLYVQQIELFLDGSVVWTQQREALAVQLATSMAAEKMPLHP